MEARMCLSIPAKITEIKQGGFPLMGIVDFGGVSREICLDYVPEAQVGQYALIHVGFAISLLDEEEALATIDMLREMSELEDEIETNSG
jgi:hydrogenase expression/formation protein HypC